jgi:hypothetical protein
MTHPNVVKAAMITESILLSAPYKSPEDKAPPRRIPSAIATIEQKIIRTKKLTRTLKFVSFSIFDRFEGVSPILQYQWKNSNVLNTQRISSNLDSS